MFRTDRGIIEAGRHRMGQFDLAFFIGEEKGFRSLQNAEPSTLKPRGVLTTANAFAAGFHPDHPYMLILQEWMEEADRVAATADAGDQQIGQSFFALENLPARFHANDALEITHHHWIRMRAED